MLTEDQIDYLFQIKESPKQIPEATVRIMLGALKWTQDEIDRGIAFINRPDEAQPRLAPKEFKPETPPEPEPLKHIVIKQNPFPVGSPFDKALKAREVQRHKRLVVLGFIVGAVVFIIGVVVYSQFFGK